MIRLDQLKVNFSADALLGYDKKAFQKYGSFDDDDEIEATWHKLKSEREIEDGLNRKLGITGIILKESRLQMEISSKVLRENYYELINQNNIEKVLDNINKTKLIEIDKAEFLDTAECYKFDVTSNLQVEKESDVYLRDISILGTKRKYDIKPYKSGIVISHLSKTVDERLIAYDKYQDLLKKDKWNKQILKFIDVNDYKGVFRIEGNYRNYDTMRKYFHFQKNNKEILSFKNKTSIYLADVLLSPLNPNLELFNNMLSEEVDTASNLLLELLDDESVKLYKIEKQVGRAEILKYCGYNIHNVRRLLNDKLKTKNISKYLRDYETLLNRINSTKIPDYKNINEVRELLKVA